MWLMQLIKLNWKGNWAKNHNFWVLQTSSVSLTAVWFNRINIGRVGTAVCAGVWLSACRVWSVDLLQLLSFFPPTVRREVKKKRFLANEILRGLRRKDVGSRCRCNDNSTSPETNYQFSRVASCLFIAFDETEWQRIIIWPWFLLELSLTSISYTFWIVWFLQPPLTGSIKVSENTQFNSNCIWLLLCTYTHVCEA